MTSRPATGRYELTRGFDEDYIPSTPGFPGPTRRLPFVADRVSGFNGINPREGWRVTFDRETKVLTIDARRNTVEASEYNAVLADTRKHGEVCQVILLVCQDTLQEQGMAEFIRNGFETEGYNDNLQFRFIQKTPRQWKTSTPQALTLEEKAARIKERAMKEKEER